MIFTELFKGRPADSAGRCENEIKTYDYLDGLGIEYERLDHEPAFTMEVCDEIDRSLHALICKNLFLCNRQKTEFCLLMISGGKQFKTKDLSAQIGSARLSFADSGHMEELLGVSPGSVSVMGLINDKRNRVRLLIDRDVVKSEYFGCHPCINTSSLRMKTADLIEKFIPSTGHDYTLVTL